MSLLSKPFEPNQAQTLAKARLERWAADREGVVPATALSLEQLQTIVRTRLIEDWLKDPEFAAWFFDQEEFLTLVQSYRVAALRRIAKIAFDETGLFDPKEQLRAAGMLLEIAGARGGAGAGAHALPPAVSPELLALPDSDVDREARDIQRRLKTRDRVAAGTALAGDGQPQPKGGR